MKRTVGLVPFKTGTNGHLCGDPIQNSHSLVKFSMINGTIVGLSQIKAEMYLWNRKSGRSWTKETKRLSGNYDRPNHSFTVPLGSKVLMWISYTKSNIMMYNPASGKVSKPLTFPSSEKDKVRCFMTANDVAFVQMSNEEKIRIYSGLSQGDTSFSTLILPSYLKVGKSCTAVALTDGKGGTQLVYHDKWLKQVYVYDVQTQTARNLDLNYHSTKPYMIFAQGYHKVGIAINHRGLRAMWEYSALTGNATLYLTDDNSLLPPRIQSMRRRSFFEVRQARGWSILDSLMKYQNILLQKPTDL